MTQIPPPDGGEPTDAVPPQAPPAAPMQQPPPPPPPPPPAYGYGAPGYGQPASYPMAYDAYGRPMPVGQSTNGFAIASLVLGIVMLCGVGSILALVFGYKARREIDASRGLQGGRGMAVAGIVLGWVGIGLMIAYIGLLILAAATDSGSSNNNYDYDYGFGALIALF